jgi:hypothetical protein
MEELKSIAIKSNKLLKLFDEEYNKKKKEVIFDLMLHWRKINYDFEVLKFKYR